MPQPTDPAPGDRPPGYFRTAPAAEVEAARGELLQHGRIVSPLPSATTPDPDGPRPPGYFRTAPASEVAEAIGQLAHRPAPGTTDTD